MKTHEESMRLLREAVDVSCQARLSKWLGRPFTEDDRIDYHAAESYGDSRKIESAAQRHLWNLRRVLGDCERFVSAYERGTGAFVAEALADAVPEIRTVLDRAVRDAVVPAGTADTKIVKPTRATFVVEALEMVANAQGLSVEVVETGPKRTLRIRTGLKPQVIALYTLLSGTFWPYTPADERGFLKKSGRYPSASEVILKEVERVRQFLVK